MMDTCPYASPFFHQEVISEMFAVTTHFTLLQYLAAKVAGLPARVPTLIGAAIPLSHYTLSFLEHKTYPEKLSHSAKHRLERAIVISFLTTLIIRSYKQTPHQIPYSWVPIPLLTAFIGANLTT